jgi:hypothetical protein
MIAQPDTLADLTRFLDLLWQPDDVREVRSPAPRRVASGYFDDPDRLVAAVAAWDGRANLYLTLNPVRPALLARYANRIEPDARSTTSDADIVERRFLLVDIDPKRPSGISSTTTEQAAARDAARAVRAYLAGQGWPGPIVAMTGNGYALLYRIALPNDAESMQLVSGVLAHLSARFDSDEVSIDTTVSNAARIACLVGTVKRKGDATADRPHRRSALVHVPEALEVVPSERLAELAPPASETARPHSDRTGDSGLPAGWVREWLTRAGIAYREQPRGTATWYKLDDCPFHPGEDVEGNCGVGEAADGRGMGKCFHNRGSGRTWHDFREALRLGPTDPIRIISSREQAAESPEHDEPERWPEPPAEAAYHGVAGAIAQAIAPHTEADPVALLATILTTFGALAGDARTLYQGSMQRANLFTVLVGDTGVGRKGTAGSVAGEVFGVADPGWDSIIVPGLGSGEGLVGHLKRGAEENGEYRALVREHEFGRLLRVMTREGSTLSPILRDGWDGQALGRVLARESAIVHRHHVALIGHVTSVELRDKLSDVDAANGFSNRFLFVAVRRSRLVPFPRFPRETITPYIEDLHRAILEAQAPGELTYTPESADRWEALYAAIPQRRPAGLLGALTARAEAQIARLALVYALLDRSGVIAVDHLAAAEALWDYAARSTRYVFGETTGNKHADYVLRLLRREGELDRQYVKQETGLRLGADLDAVERALTAAGFAELVTVARPGGGRGRRVLRLANGTNGRNGQGAAHEKAGITPHD